MCNVPSPWNYEFDNLGLWFIEPIFFYNWYRTERNIYNPFKGSSTGCPDNCDAPFIIAGLYIEKSASSYRIQIGESVTYYYRIYTWDRAYSFKNDPRSLREWLSANIPNIYIDKDGFLVLDLYPSDSSFVIQSPSLTEILGEKSFDGIRILYSNRVETRKGGLVGRIGWVDERMVDKKTKGNNLNNAPKGGTVREITIPQTPKSKFKWITIGLS